MNNGKYSNVLTMLLVVFIVAILGVIVYFAFDMLNSNKINNDAQTAIDEFQKATTPVKRDRTSSSTSNEGETENEVPTENVVDVNKEALDMLNQATAERETEKQTEVEPEKVYMENYEVLGTIKIPKTNCEYPILDSITKRSLEIAVGLAPYGPGLNEVGNSIIFGHNYRNGLFFSNNKNLRNGDVIYITDKTGRTVTYEIYNIYQTDANDASYFTRDTEGKREISLQTCTDDGANRIIIWAKEK